jgi:hypothetical protein
VEALDKFPMAEASILSDLLLSKVVEHSCRVDLRWRCVDKLEWWFTNEQDTAAVVLN